MYNFRILLNGGQVEGPYVVISCTCYLLLVFLCKTELDRKLKKTEILCEVKIKNVRGRIGNI